MDGARFDHLARTLARPASRRRLLALTGALLSAVFGRVAGAGAACFDKGHVCSNHAHCCSGYCGPKGRNGRRTCETCKSRIVCGTICCPPNALNGCTSVSGPEGPVIGCLCPKGAVYHPETNECRCRETCTNDDQCCSGKCCHGVCCAPGETACCGGACIADPDACVCPPGSSCSGSATCHSYGHTLSTAGTCCSYPKAAFCCPDTYPGAGDGETGCCTPGIDCPSDGRCQNAAEGGTSLGCCDPPNEHPECGPDGDCCFHGFHGGNATNTLTCILTGKPCHPDWPCCDGACASGLCP